MEDDLLKEDGGRLCGGGIGSISSGSELQLDCPVPGDLLGATTTPLAGGGRWWWRRPPPELVVVVEEEEVLPLGCAWRRLPSFSRLNCCCCSDDEALRGGAGGGGFPVEEEADEEGIL